MKKLAISFLAPAALLVASSASAAEPAAAPAAGAPAAAEKAGETEFGDQGTIAIGAATGLDFGYTSTTHPQNAPSTNDIRLMIQPDVQYFIIQGLSVGGVLNFAWTKPNQGDSQTQFGIGPTVGYNYWITPGMLSVWPQATFTYNNASTSFQTSNGMGGTTSTSATLSSTNVGVFIPLLIHPVKHFHFGIGPYFNVDLSSSASANGQSQDQDKNLNVGIKGEIAGWL